MPALLIAVLWAVTGCGGDDAATATGTADSAVVQTVTQTATATATAPAKETSGTAPKPATTQANTQTRTSAPPNTDAEPSPPAAAPRLSGACPAVEVGARDGDVDVTYARIDQARKVDCTLAAEIAAQWGAQQMGIDKALLPLDWKCTKGNVCVNGSKRVAFTLVKPTE